MLYCLLALVDPPRDQHPVYFLFLESYQPEVIALLDMMVDKLKVSILPLQRRALEQLS